MIFGKLWIPGLKWQFKWRNTTEDTTTYLLWSHHVSTVGMAGNCHHDI